MSTLSPHGTRRWLWTGAALYAALLLVVSLALWMLQRSARERLDDALGQRLLGVAVTAAYLVDGDSLRIWSHDPDESLELVWVRSRLERVRDENGLAELTVCDPAGFVVVSSARRLARGEPNLYWDLEPDAVLAAAGGFPAAGGLVRAGDIFQKSAHAPILDADGAVTGVLTVEAEADFFDALARLRRGAWATLAAVLVVLSVLGALLLRLQRSLVRTRLEMLRQENLAMMGRMTAGIAHEIRNPLGIIRGAGEIQAAKLRQLGVELPTLDFVTEEVDRLDRILTRYLTFGKGAEAEVDLEPVNLGRLTERVARMLRPELEAVGVHVELHDDSADALVAGDSPGLQQVLLNLLLNARDAQQGGGTVEVRLDADADTVRLRVLDTGTGLGGHTQEELFEPFLTTKQKGSGLGLAVVKQVVENHGGRIGLRNRTDGPGAEALLELPRCSDTARGDD
jgi:signal transduction histidine kinase